VTVTGIVDVGGGTRGIFGAGVFDWCMDNGVQFDYVVGVSAGSANAASYLSGQRGRNLRFYDDYAFRKEYMSFQNLLRTGQYLGLDYIYGTLTAEGGEDPYDYDAMAANPTRFEIVGTDAKTGEARYFRKEDIRRDNYEYLKASCAVPIAARAYPVGGRRYYDGGIADPIPYERAFAQGCDRVVIILTRPRDALRTSDTEAKLARLLRRKYPATARALSRRNEVYNRQLQAAWELEKEGRVLILAPDDIGSMKTLTQDHEQIRTLYKKGYAEAEKLREYLGL